MTERSSAPQSARIPGESGMWVLIGGDLLVFALLFGTFLHYHGQQRELFVESQLALNQAIGFINTFLLLTSSLFVARAVHWLREGEHHRAGLQLVATLLCGAAFMVNKGIEWAHMIGEGQTLLTNDYYMFFFMLTGIHALHVLIGMGVLLYVYFRIAGGVRSAQADESVMESGAIFWHLVDLLWVVLFALLYLVR